MPRPFRFQRQDDPRHQIGDMKRHFPDFIYRIGRNGEMIWIGTLQPTEGSPRYRIRIVHASGHSPRVFVDSPPLLPGVQHIYKNDALFRYCPEEWQWQAQESLAMTIVPWTALWLYYYELWQITGEWLGPCAPHTPRKK